MSSLSVSSAGSAWAAQIKSIENAAQASQENFVSGVMGNASATASGGNLFSALSDSTATPANGITSTAGTASSATTWQAIISEIESGASAPTTSANSSASLPPAAALNSLLNGLSLNTSSNSQNQMGSVLNLLA